MSHSDIVGVRLCYESRQVVFECNELRIDYIDSKRGFAIPVIKIHPNDQRIVWSKRDKGASRWFPRRCFDSKKSSLSSVPR